MNSASCASGPRKLLDPRTEEEIDDFEETGHFPIYYDPNDLPC